MEQSRARGQGAPASHHLLASLAGSSEKQRVWQWLPPCQLVHPEEELFQIKYQTLPMGPQLHPSKPKGNGNILRLLQKPPVSVLRARYNYNIKSALMNYSAGFGVKFMLEKYMFQIS